MPNLQSNYDAGRIGQQNQAIMREVELHQYMVRANQQAVQKGVLPPFPSPETILLQPLAEQERLIAQYQAQYQQAQAEALREHNESRQVTAFAQEMERRKNILAGMQMYQLPFNAQKAGATTYQQHAAEIRDMLSGQKPLSLKRAVYLAESPYLVHVGTPLSYEAYCQSIEELVQLCRWKLVEDGFSLNNEMAKKQVIHRLMADTLIVTHPKNQKENYPLPNALRFRGLLGPGRYAKSFRN